PLAEAVVRVAVAGEVLAAEPGHDQLADLFAERQALELPVDPDVRAGVGPPLRRAERRAGGQYGQEDQRQESAGHLVHPVAAEALGHRGPRRSRATPGRPGFGHCKRMDPEWGKLRTGGKLRNGWRWFWRWACGPDARRAPAPGPGRPPANGPARSRRRRCGSESTC